MAEQTVREQLAAALEEHGCEYSTAVQPPCIDERAAKSGWCDTCLALARHRAEPECTGTYEALWETLGRLFSWEDDPRSIPIGMWSAAYNAFKAARSEPHCDTSCPCYQEGLEAQRERVGGGTA